MYVCIHQFPIISVILELLKQTFNPHPFRNAWCFDNCKADWKTSELDQCWTGCSTCPGHWLCRSARSYSDQNALAHESVPMCDRSRAERCPQLYSQRPNWWFDHSSCNPLSWSTWWSKKRMKMKCSSIRSWGVKYEKQKNQNHPKEIHVCQNAFKVFDNHILHFGTIMRPLIGLSNLSDFI